MQELWQQNNNKAASAGQQTGKAGEASVRSLALVQVWLQALHKAPPHQSANND
jgi:hypothetical protein